MGIKITSVSDAVEDNGIKILVHAPAGSGKTVLSATTGVPTLIVSAESGLLSIKNAPKYIETTIVKTIDELENVYDYLVNEGGCEKYEWVNIDSISEIAEVLLSDEKEGSKDARQAYGNLQDRMMKLLRAFRDLPCNVLMTCKQKRQEDADSGIVSFVPMLPGSALTQNISYLFDEVFALQVIRKQDDAGNYYDERLLQTARDRKFEAKDRSGELDFFEEPNLKRLAAKIRGGAAKKSEVVSEVETETETEVDGHVHAETESETEAPVNSGVNDSDVDDGYAIAEKKLYWIHEDSDGHGVIEKDERYNLRKMENNDVVFCSKKDYTAFVKKIEESEEEE